MVQPWHGSGTPLSRFVHGHYVQKTQFAKGVIDWWVLPAFQNELTCLCSSGSLHLNKVTALHRARIIEPAPQVPKMAKRLKNKVLLYVSDQRLEAQLNYPR